MYRRFKKNLNLASSWIFNPTVISRKLSNIKKSKIDSLDLKIYSLFTKRRSRLLYSRMSYYNIFLSILKKKILYHSDFKRFDYFNKNIFETKSNLENNLGSVSYLISNTNKYSILNRSLMYIRSVSRSNLLDSFGLEYSNIFNNLNYKYKFVEPDNCIVSVARNHGLKNYWNNLLYIYTSKYRYPNYENTHSFCRGKIKNNLLSLVTMNTKLLNKNYDSLENLSKTYFKKIDFLKRMTDKSPYQFMSKIPKFFKKNKWIFSLYEFTRSSSNYSVSV